MSSTDTDAVLLLHYEEPLCEFGPTGSKGSLKGKCAKLILFSREVGPISQRSCQMSEAGDWFIVRPVWKDHEIPEFAGYAGRFSSDEVKKIPTKLIHKSEFYGSNSFLKFNAQGIVCEVAKNYMTIFNCDVGLIIHFGKSNVDLRELFAPMQPVHAKMDVFIGSRLFGFLATSVNGSNKYRAKHLKFCDGAEIVTGEGYVMAITKTGTRVLLLTDKLSPLKVEDSPLMEGDIVKLAYYRVLTRTQTVYLGVFYENKEEEFFDDIFERLMKDKIVTDEFFVDEFPTKNKSSTPEEIKKNPRETISEILRCWDIDSADLSFYEAGNVSSSVSVYTSDGESICRTESNLCSEGVRNDSTRDDDIDDEEGGFTMRPLEESCYGSDDDDSPAYFSPIESVHESSGAHTVVSDEGLNVVSAMESISSSTLRSNTEVTEVDPTNLEVECDNEVESVESLNSIGTLGDVGEVDPMEIEFEFNDEVESVESNLSIGNLDVTNGELTDIDLEVADDVDSVESNLDIGNLEDFEGDDIDAEPTLEHKVSAVITPVVSNERVFAAPVFGIWRRQPEPAVLVQTPVQSKSVKVDICPEIEENMEIIYSMTAARQERRMTSRDEDQSEDGPSRKSHCGRGSAASNPTPRAQSVFDFEPEQPHAKPTQIAMMTSANPTTIAAPQGWPPIPKEETCCEYLRRVMISVDSRESIQMRELLCIVADEPYIIHHVNEKNANWKSILLKAIIQPNVDATPEELTILGFEETPLPSCPLKRRLVFEKLLFERVVRDIPAVYNEICKDYPDL